MDYVAAVVSLMLIPIGVIMLAVQFISIFGA